MRCVCVWGGVSESSPRSARRVLGCSEGVSLRASRSPPSRFTAAGASPLSEGGGGGRRESGAAGPRPLRRRARPLRGETSGASWAPGRLHARGR